MFSTNSATIAPLKARGLASSPLPCTSPNPGTTSPTSTRNVLTSPSNIKVNKETPQTSSQATHGDNNIVEEKSLDIPYDDPYLLNINVGNAFGFFLDGSVLPFTVKGGSFKMECITGKLCFFEFDDTVIVLCMSLFFGDERR